jgi:acetyl-CoA C-acetyltransferase
LARQGLTLEDIDVIELNEAFAVQALACIKLGNFPIDKINPSGGATAFGHPYGATGAILVTRMLTELNRNEKNRLGIVTMCVGGGQGAAMLIRKVEPNDAEQ